MLHRYSTLLKLANFILDYCALNLSLIIGYYALTYSKLSWIDNKAYFPMVVIINLLWLLCANITDLYNSILIKNSVKTFKTAIKAYLLFLLLIYVAVLKIVGLATLQVTSQYLFFSSIAFGLLLTFWKVTFLLIRRYKKHLFFDERKVVIIGSGPLGQELQRFFVSNLSYGYNFLGFFDRADRVNSSKFLLGGIENCIAYALQHDVSEIYCTVEHSEMPEISHLLLEADRNLIRFMFVPPYHDFIKKPTFLQNYGNIPIIALRPEPLESLLNRLLKRTFDIIFSLFVLIFVLSWLFIIISILIRLESRGPIIFKQKRSGRKNEPFYCYKFRTMFVNGESDLLQASRHDKRITKVGAFLRKTSLDELPQFCNTLIGNMSVVGPRPHMLSHTEEYAKLIDKFMIRHYLKPGITGWAQINGLRGETKLVEEMEKRVEADVWYLENWSFLLDCKIILLTFWKSIKGDDKAY